jgi:hypothetical protein
MKILEQFKICWKDKKQTVSDELSEYDKEKLKNLSDEVSNFVFDEAVKKLASVNADQDTLDKKSFVIGSVLISILGIVISFTTQDIKHIKFLIPYGILVSGFLISLWLLAKSVATKKYYGSSFKPAEILEAHEFYLKTKPVLINSFLINWYNTAISHNCKENKKRGFWINIAFALSLASLSIFVMFYAWFKIIL